MGVLPPPSTYANVNSIFLALIDLAPLAFKNRGALRDQLEEKRRSKKRAVKTNTVYTIKEECSRVILSPLRKRVEHRPSFGRS